MSNAEGCKLCNHTGICPHCCGDSEDEDFLPTCRLCNGSGECPYCDRTGAVEYARPARHMTDKERP